MKNVIIPFLFIGSFGFSQEENLNITLVGTLDYENSCNDIWGYVDESGNEYALVGTTQSTSIVSLIDPQNPVEVDEVPGTNSIWRDIKVYDHYAYVTADRGRDGLLIIDLSTLPDSIKDFKFWTPSLDLNGIPADLQTCHNLYIENGFVYLAGCNISNQGVLILDVRDDPMNPVLVGAADLAYSHDAFVKDDILYTSEIFEGNMGIYNVSDKSNPVLLATQPTSREFTHNVWSSDDNQYAFTTDERGDGFLDSYIVSDKNQIRRLDQYQPIATKGMGVIPHNTHFMDDYLITSWYTDGVIIVDAHQPDNLIRTGQYDTWSGAPSGFNGCWGAYPFLPSGLLLASDISSGLYVLRPDYRRAAYIEGTVTDNDTNGPINNVQVDILTNIPNESTTGAFGQYKTGIHESGIYQVVAHHPSYEPDTIEVEMINGEITIANFFLKSRAFRNISGVITDTETGNPIPNAHIRFELAAAEFEINTDENGFYALEVFQGQAKVYIGQFGYKTSKRDIIINVQNNLDFALEKGIMDDFNFDFGWTVEKGAATGNWERAIPLGTSLSSDIIANPDTDLVNDLGSYAFVTGNNGPGVGDDDVDDGTTSLISPLMDLSEYTDPHINYTLWFFNGGGDSTPNDNLQVYLSNGTERFLIEEVTNTNGATGRWRERSIVALRDYFSDYSSVQVIISTSDESPGHVVEGGFDGFSVTEGRTTATSESNINQDVVRVSPNPFTNEISVISSEQNIQSLKIHNLSGQLIHKMDQLNSASIDLNVLSLPSGTYLVKIEFDNGQIVSKKIIKVSDL